MILRNGKFQKFKQFLSNFCPGFFLVLPKANSRGVEFLSFYNVWIFVPPPEKLQSLPGTETQIFCFCLLLPHKLHRAYLKALAFTGHVGEALGIPVLRNFWAEESLSWGLRAETDHPCRLSPKRPQPRDSSAQPFLDRGIPRVSGFLGAWAFKRDPGVVTTQILDSFPESSWTSLSSVWFAVDLDRAHGRGGFGSQTAADPLWWPPQSPWKADLKCFDSISQNANPASTFELSQCLRCKEGLPGPRKAFGCPPAVCPPRRPRPFAHYSFSWFYTSGVEVRVAGG